MKKLLTLVVLGGFLVVASGCGDKATTSTKTQTGGTVKETKIEEKKPAS